MVDNISRVLYCYEFMDFVDNLIESDYSGTHNEMEISGDVEVIKITSNS